MVNIANYLDNLTKDLRLLKKDWRNTFLHFSL